MYFSEYDSCILCPRDCHVNRNMGKHGFCKQDANLYVAWAGLHFGEEPPITARGGSGIIFITGCNLACAFCQNYQISQDGMGFVVDSNTFASICLALQKEGAENINIVTGSHHTLPILEGLNLARKKGLLLPILWNTSSYEKKTEIERLSHQIDIWLPDLKTLDSSFSHSLFNASNYPQIATDAILTMTQNSPLLYETKEKEKLISGVIVRHLALPNRISDTESVIRWFSRNLKDRALLSIMTQYTPINRKEATKAPTRYISDEENDRLRELLSKYDVEEGFYQELVQDSSWLPDFNKMQPFSSSLARPVWHWLYGFV
ncbi:MAG: radical SAM protein [Treponema sp.]